MDRPVRVAVVGLGWPGQRHLDGYRRNPQAEIIAVCDADETLRASIQRDYGIARGFGDLDALLALPELDAVSICTPNYLHEPMVRTSLAAGKNVLCEKPLAATLAQGERIAAAARESDRVCMIGFSRRFREDSRAVKALVENGDLGSIYHARVGWLRRRFNPSVRGWFLSKEHSGGGPLIDLGVHLLDLGLWYMGHPRVVTVSGSVGQHFGERIGRGAPIDVEDNATAYLRLDNGATLVLETSWYAYSGTSDHVFCELLGTKGGAKLDQPATNANAAVELYVDRGDVPLVAAPVLPAVNFTNESFVAETAEFVAAIRENRPPSATVEQGLEILRLLDAIYRSAAAGAEIRL